LRQEFRDLELLDEITTLRYNKKLPDIVQGITRNPLIVSYRSWKGTQYIFKTMHRSLKWSNEDPYPLNDPEPDSPWQIVTQDKLKELKPVYKHLPAKRIKALLTVSNDQGEKKKKRMRVSDETGLDDKKMRTASPLSLYSSPVSFIWDENNYSCAYDSLFSILLKVFTDCSQQWNDTVKNQN
ncbi:uncharacterized protein LAESUDRAFT_614928, partial [Laetiporus sulphureus 93-53]